jgi:hypothetical protein
VASRSKKTSKGWDAYVGNRYVGSYSTSKQALKAAKSSDVHRRAEKSKRKQKYKWVCICGRPFLVEA